MEINIFIDHDYPINHDLSSNFILGDKLSNQGAHSEVRIACIKNDCNYIAKIMTIVTSSNKYSTEYDFMRNEMIITKQMSNIGIAPTIYDMSLSNEKGLMIMDRYDGTLKELLWLYQTDKTLPIEMMLKSIENMINKMHDQGVVHRDLNPDNILYTIDRLVAISDFGSALYSKSEELRELDRNFFRCTMDAYNKINNGENYDDIWDIYLDIVSFERPNIQFIYNGDKIQDWQ